VAREADVAEQTVYNYFPTRTNWLPIVKLFGLVQSH
jgi:hypothetical protein